MMFGQRLTCLFFLMFMFMNCTQASTHYNFVVKEAPYTRLCSTKNILTINGKFPGPTIRVHKGDTIYVRVHNKGNHNITIHWHGVKQPRNPWSDGPEYITQCPIQPGETFNQKIIFSNEEGTLWWHAHSDWLRATVHGAIEIFPKKGTTFPFPKPHKQIPIILGEWWKKDILEVLEEFVVSGGQPNVSDAFTINGQPGDFYNCSKPGTFKLVVEQNKRYLLRIINAAMNEILFFSIAQHNLTVVGIDGSYTKPLTTNFITISPGQTIDALLQTAMSPPNRNNRQYYMAARAYSTGVNVTFDNTTTTAILQYKILNDTVNDDVACRLTGQPLFPYYDLPYYNDTNSALNFVTSLRSLANQDHPINVPIKINKHIFSTISINTFPCPNGYNVNDTCQGPNGTRLAASMNNISFVFPNKIDVLEAYYFHINGIVRANFPIFPPLLFNFTGDFLPLALQTPMNGTRVRVLEYGSNVELVFQGTNLVAGIDHPMHLHGFSFYVVGYGLGNFDPKRDELGYNLVDPPLQNTVMVPKNGWATIRFAATNPGVWFMHCHLERHLTWGMDTVFIVKNGKYKQAQLLPPPPDMPPC
ncbi:hypothetical protein F8388_000883 [Cannabis sativa]|uniref:Laccase n=1 Tax=Cannabis sativa TaxID=3483 RepID=A0A7J6FPV0_CANSA|nr:hypothetical protein G4B88_030541 [Cannabis sativa]KAF4372716.1 hypothetical protein F8388_000883 [Cannabis sativa]